MNARHSQTDVCDNFATTKKEKFMQNIHIQTDHDTDKQGKIERVMRDLGVTFETAVDRESIMYSATVNVGTAQAIEARTASFVTSFKKT